jgi:hypothetical protein
MIGRLLRLGAPALAALLLLPAGAATADGPLIVDTGPFEFADKDGNLTLAIDVINTGTEPLALHLEPADGDCAPTADPILNPGRSTTITFTFPAECDPGDDGVKFTLTSDPATSTVELTAKRAADAQPAFEWDSFDAYLIALGIAAGLVMLGWYFSKVGGDKWLAFDAKWTFKDSYASTTAVGAAVFTGLFGATDVLKAIFGDSDAKTLTSTALVGAALTAALAGVGPLLLTVLHAGRPADRPDYERVLGVALASTCVFGGQLGFIWVMLGVVHDSSLTNNGVANATAAIAAVLIVLYAFFSTIETFNAGLERAKKPAGDLAGLIADPAHQPRAAMP